jgi:hypothetical protein
MHYFPLLAADAVELTNPYFDMYLRQLPSCCAAAGQRWGVAGGAFIQETASFDGAVELSEEHAQEFGDVLAGKKSHTELSSSAAEAGQFDGHLYATQRLCDGRFHFVSHLLSSGSELAVQAWWRYRYTGDATWFARAYPLLRDTVEFYRHMVALGDDGCYHIVAANVHEDFWGVTDGIMDLAAIRGTVPLALRAAEILGVDEDLRAPWQRLLDRLAPYPLGDHPRARALTGGVLAEDTWAAGLLGEVDGSHNLEDVWLNPIFPFEDWTLETRQPLLDERAQRAVTLAPRMRMILEGADCNTAIRTPIAAVRAGRGEELPALLASYYRAFQPLANGWGLFEGADQAHSIEALGCISTALQEALLQSVSPAPGEPEVITVCPAWPKAWVAEFRLLARGAFLITAAVRDGAVEFVEVASRLGEMCRLRNPWGGPCRVEGSHGTTVLSGDILSFPTVPAESYRVLPAGAPPQGRRRVVAESTVAPASYSFRLSNGVVAGGVLGRYR